MGTVSVWNDAENLHVTYNTTDGWVMTETHLAVVAEFTHFPTNKPGNPKVGLFPYGDENIFMDTWEETIELSAIPAVVGEGLYIAAHAVVLNETAIGLGDNLVVNGGFELPIVGSSGWSVFATDTPNLEWIVEPTTSPWDLGQPQGLELQRLSPPHSGAQYAELDAYDPVKIYQDLLTTSTKGSYTLTYAWSPRPGVPVNEIEVRWNDTLIATHSTNVSSGIAWTVETHTGLVPNESGTTRLEFTETGPHDQLGMFLDSVSVVQEDTESAWADGDRFNPKKGNWATYFEYTVEGCPCILSISENIKVLDAPLTDARLGALEDNGYVHVWKEFEGPLQSDLNYDLADGQSAESVINPVTMTISVGTPVCIYYVHLDGVGTEGLRLEGDIEFGADIMGLIISGGNLGTFKNRNLMFTADTIVGYSVTTYPPSSGTNFLRGLEANYSTSNDDNAVFNGPTVNFNMFVSNGHDSFRVIVPMYHN